MPLTARKRALTAIACRHGLFLTATGGVEPERSVPSRLPDEDNDMHVITYPLERLSARPVGRRHTTIAIYSTATAAWSAATRLYNMGVDMEKVSLVGCDYPLRKLVDDVTSERLLRESIASPSEHKETGDLCALGSELIRLGVSRENAVKYEMDIQQGRSLLVMHGSLAETCRAAALLEITSHHGLAEHES